MAEEPAGMSNCFGNHVVELLEKMGKIPDSAKEVFLWDLIRLANGALYMYRLECVHEGKIEYTQDSDFVVGIEADKDNKTLSIIHKGIGWTKDDLMCCLGCTPAGYIVNYLDTIDEYLMNGDPNPYYSALLSWLFSPGLFSAFMVADRVVITSTTKQQQQVGPTPTHKMKKKQRVQYVWDATATDGVFKLARADPKTVLDGPLMKRGTKVTLYLKKEYEKTYLDETKLRELVDKYTFDVCPYPIYVSDADGNHDREKKRRRHTKDREEEEEDLKSLKNDFEDLGKLCLEALGCRGVKKVVFSDRVFDLPGHLLTDTTTYVINPRSPIMKSLLVDFKKDPNSPSMRKKLKETFRLHWVTFSAIDYTYGLKPTYEYDERRIGDDYEDEELDYDDDDDDDDELIDEDDEPVMAPPILSLPGYFIYWLK